MLERFKTSRLFVNNFTHSVLSGLKYEFEELFKDGILGNSSHRIITIPGLISELNSRYDLFKNKYIKSVAEKIETACNKILDQYDVKESHNTLTSNIIINQGAKK